MNAAASWAFYSFFLSFWLFPDSFCFPSWLLLADMVVGPHQELSHSSVVMIVTVTCFLAVENGSYTRRPLTRVFFFFKRKDT